MKLYRRSLLEASTKAAANLLRDNVLRAISKVKAKIQPPLPLSAEALKFLIADESLRESAW